MVVLTTLTNTQQSTNLDLQQLKSYGLLTEQRLSDIPEETEEFLQFKVDIDQEDPEKRSKEDPGKRPMADTVPDNLLTQPATDANPKDHTKD